MSGAVQSLYKDVAGTLFFEIPEGKVTAALLTITKSDGSDLTTAVTAVDIKTNFASPAVDTTLSLAANRDDLTFTLTAVTNVTPECDFLIDGGTPMAEWIKVKTVNASTKVVTPYRPLTRAHAAGAAFQNTKLYYTVTVGNNDSVMYLNKATVAYTTALGAFKRTWLYDVKYNQFMPTLTETRIFDTMPHIASWGFAEQKGFDAQMREGLARLKDQVFLLGKDLDDLIDAKSAERAHLYATIWVIASAWSAKDPDVAAFAANQKREFESACHDLIRMARWFEIADQDGILSAGTEATFYGRRALNG